MNDPLYRVVNEQLMRIAAVTETEQCGSFGGINDDTDSDVKCGD